jgi:hypothetical protein
MLVLVGNFIEKDGQLVKVDIVPNAKKLWIEANRKKEEKK